MALTIQSNPGSYFSIHGDLIFTVYESTKANDPINFPNYKYVCDIYIGATMVARLKSVPHPDNKMGVFNVASVVRNYVSTVLDPTPLARRAQQIGLGEFYVEATMKFGEEYDFDLYTNVTVDSARVYFNHYNGRMIGTSTNLAAMVWQPLTVRPFQNYTRRDAQFVFFPFLPGGTGATDTYLNIDFFYNDGSQSASGGYFTPATANTLQQFNVSPAAIGATMPGGVFPANVRYYEVAIAVPDPYPEPRYRFDFTCEPKYEVYTLHFLNRFGGFESREFTKVSRKTIEIEKQEYGKLPYTINGSGAVSYYSTNKVYNETRAVYSSQYKEKMVLNTDILTDAEYRWLSDLVLSPMVFIELEGYFIPCVITGNNYEFRKTINGKLTNLTLNIEFGDQFNAQYR